MAHVPRGSFFAQDEERYVISSPQFAPHDDDVSTFGGGSTTQYTTPDVEVVQSEKGGESESESDTEIEDNSDDLDPEDYQRRIESLYNVNRPQTSLEVDDMQQAGILFVLQCLLGEEGPQGCLLAHFMGCGKTMQVVTALAIIANAVESNSPGNELIPDQLRTSSTLILCPASLVQKWVEEFERWAPHTLCGMLGAIRSIRSGSTLAVRQREIGDWVQSGGVLIMSYDMLKTLVNNPEFDGTLLTRTPNIVVADEAHLLSNPKSKRTQVCRNFATKARIGVSGTPMSNVETGYQNIMQWVSHHDPRQEHMNSIQHWSPGDSGETGSLLPTASRPVLPEVSTSRVHRVGGSQLALRLPQKTELTLIVPLTEIQKRLYEKCYTRLPNSSIRRALLSSCCAHPSLLLRQTGSWRPRTMPEDVSQELLDILTECDAVGSVNHSYRTTLTDQIVEESIEAGDKVVIFSQSLATLTYLERHFDSRKRKCCRIDGTTAVNKRQSIIDAFNTNSDGANVCLTSTKTGGMGFHITGANRVIIFDFKHDPTYTEQAVGRVYRKGQRKAVFVYRFIGGGTYEEAMHNTATRRLNASSRRLDDESISRLVFRDPEDKYALREVIPQDLSHIEGVDTVLDSILRSNPPIADIHMSATVDVNDWVSTIHE